MNRDEKNEMTRGHILRTAVKEFADRGYDGSSMNDVCALGGFSKGIIYHYYADKKELYLACMKEMFQNLTEYIRKNLKTESLDAYCACRMNFFAQNQDEAMLFLQAVTETNKDLAAGIRQTRREFDVLNREVLKGSLAGLKLREDIREDEIMEIVMCLTTFLNTQFPGNRSDEKQVMRHETYVQKAISILLYGIVKR